MLLRRTRSACARDMRFLVRSIPRFRHCRYTCSHKDEERCGVLLRRGKFKEQSQPCARSLDLWTTADERLPGPEGRLVVGISVCGYINWKAPSQTARKSTSPGIYRRD